MLCAPLSAAAGSDGPVPVSAVGPVRGLSMGDREALLPLEYPEHPAKLKGPHKPVVVNGVLRRFLGRGVSTRPAITRYISRYVRARGLQVQDDRTKFRPDANLRAILGVEECTFLQIGKYISPHLTKIDLEDDADRLLREFVSSVYGKGPLPNEISPGQRPSNQRQHSRSPAEEVKWCYGEDQIVTLRRQNGFFVDKTRFIVMMENDASTHQVLLRPSRSGKSLLTSQMQVYHDIHTTQELFDEVFLNRDGSPTDAYVLSSGGTAEGARAYCVLPLDFSIQVHSGPDAPPLDKLFRDVLNGAMLVFMNKYRVHVSQWREDNADANLKALASGVGAAGHQLLVLVDEYDRTFNQLMREDPIAYQDAVAPARDRRPAGFLRAFYLTLKSLPKLISTRVRSFTTGIAPIALTDSSGWNVAWPLTHLGEYAECCGFTEADVERGLSQVGLTEAERIPTLRLMRKFYNGYKFESESQPLYLAAYVIYFFKTLQRGGKERAAILKERDESKDALLAHYMKDNNVSLSHNVTSVLRSSSRAGVVALQDAFQASKELTVPTWEFESPFTLAELSPRTGASVDLVRDPMTQTVTDASTSRAYHRALTLLFYHGVLSVRRCEEDGTLTVLNPPNLLACLDHFTQLKMALGSDILFLERLIATPSCQHITLLVDAVLHGWDSGALALDSNFSEQCLSSAIEAAVGGWLRTQPSVDAVLTTGRGHPVDLGPGRLGFHDLMLQNKSGSSRVLLELKVVRVNGILYDDEELTKAAGRRGDFVDAKVDSYLNSLSYQEKLDLRLNSKYLYGLYCDCKTVGDLVMLALRQVESYHWAVGQPVRSFVVVLVGTRALVAEYVVDETSA
ncbi:hypothetical protein I4F81_006641 [Pyropia yezoensis]|uniref:Uncharacterized protein n=1 Tax=Pyropia yezoensis TaxID=2788 RepID=A0ACC3C1C4_PYRYE|nr:hypothetical protein I4F81_006641 [Neopyropia yezoensis]